MSTRTGATVLRYAWNIITFLALVSLTDFLAYALAVELGNGNLTNGQILGGVAIALILASWALERVLSRLELNAALDALTAPARGNEAGS